MKDRPGRLFLSCCDVVLMDLGMPESFTFRDRLAEYFSVCPACGTGLHVIEKPDYKGEFIFKQKHVHHTEKT